MKFAKYIFTLYIFALALIPCGDGGGGIVEIAKYFLELNHNHVSNHEQHSNNCGDDSCSPFCICSCCSLTLETPEDIIFLDKYVAPFPQGTPAHINTLSPCNFRPSIWHPPILS